MKILIHPEVVYCKDDGNEGLTGIVGLTTSHASFHIWSEVEKPFINFDVYSCKTFNPDDVINHLKQFGLLEYNFKMIDRNP